MVLLPHAHNGNLYLEISMSSSQAKYKEQIGKYFLKHYLDLSHLQPY